MSTSRNLRPRRRSILIELVRVAPQLLGAAAALLVAVTGFVEMLTK
jgi:hypothetical protein